MRRDPDDALSRLGLIPAEVTVEDLVHNRWLTPGIWRVSASGRPMVLKCLSPDRPLPETPWDAHWTTGAHEHRRWNYWAREGLAYRDRLVEVYEPGGIVAPAVLDADYADDAIVLLLEFVDGRPGEQWAVADLSPAPWFGLPICDARSYPQNACTPDSDTNSGVISDPNAAGSAFLELQFYPPKFQPFQDGISCDATHWCAALNIDSLECTFGFATCNNNCIEPVNFAFLQMNGVPAGPPSPQLTDTKTFLPNGQTLMMNPGDTVSVTIQDTSQGLSTAMTDRNTGRTGFMVASAANGFMNTNIADCNGNPFSFHAEYSTARQQNQVPWAALEGGVLMEQEIGHFEPCDAVANAFPFMRSFADGQSFSDPQTFQTCVGGFEGSAQTGEGPCDLTTGVCPNARTEGGAPCPTSDFNSGALCEFSDALCVPAGPRTLTINGSPVTVSWPVAGCEDNTFQNGDLDFDGSSYLADWPDGSPTRPTSFAYLGPFTGGQPYPQVQFETDVGGSEIKCDTATGAGCTAHPARPGRRHVLTVLDAVQQQLRVPVELRQCDRADRPSPASAASPSTARPTSPGTAAPSPALS